MVSLDFSISDMSETLTMKMLAEALVSCPIVQITLYACRITDQGITEFCQFLKRKDVSHTLKQLDLSDNRLSSSSLVQLFNVLNDNSGIHIQQLNLSQNQFKEANSDNS